ncbi:MAG: MBL fold metallo-hydrolase, partial [Ilumatobacteraceae bacterium]
MAMQQRALGAHTTVLFGASQGKFPDGNSVLVRGTHSTVLIDPSLTVREASPPLTADLVLLTHTHEDHTAGLSAVEAAAISVHEHDLAAVRSLDGLMALYGIPSEHEQAMRVLVQQKYHFAGWPQATGFVDGALWDLGEVSVRAVHTPGHTAGHCVFLIEPHDGTH